MKRILLGMAAVLMLVAPATAQTASDLAMVPANAVAVVHLDAAALWKHDILKGLRDTVAAAGPKALEAYGKQVYPHPEQLARVTLYVTLNENDPKQEPNVAVIVAFKTDVDGKKIQQLYLPEAKMTMLGEKNAMVDMDRKTALYMPDARHLVVGNIPGVTAFNPKSEGPAHPAVAAANGKILTLFVNVKGLPIPEDALRDVPPDLVPLLKAERVMLTMDGAGAEPVFQLTADYGSEAAAGDAEKAMKAGIAMIKNELKKPKQEMEQMLYKNADKGPQALDKMGEATMGLIGLGGLNRIEALLDDLPVARKGSAMVVTVTMPAAVVQYVGMMSAAVGLMLPAVQKVREAASSTSSMNNLKYIGVCFWNYVSQYGKLPPAAICDKNGKPLLSWRVAILPYIEQDNLYRQFKLDEPWDSEHNKKLIPLMPKTYMSPRVVTAPGMTVYKAFVGKDAVLDWKASRNIVQITDGTSNTMLVAEAGEAVTWTKPEEIEFDPAKPLPKLELPGGLKQIGVLFTDGHVRRIDLNRWDEKALKAYIGAADGIWVDDPDASPAPRAVPKAAPPVESKEQSRPAAPGAAKP